MITVIGWEQYNLWIKKFKDMKEVRQYVKENPNLTIIAMSGKIKYKSSMVRIR